MKVKGSQNLNEKKIQKAYTWLNANIGEFEPTPLDSFFGIKKIGELLLLCMIYKRVHHNLSYPRNKFVSFAKNSLLRIGYIDKIVREPELLLPYAAAVYIST